MAQNEYFVVYDTATGAELWRGQGPIGTASIQELPQGAKVLVVPQEAILSQPANLSVIAGYYAALIDAQAEAVRSQFITPGAGQAMTYLRKEAEARAYLANNEAPVPFLTAEAEATGTTVASLAALVTAQADAWLTVGPKIEAARIGAKKAINEAGNIAVLHTASQVDWQAVAQ